MRIILFIVGWISFALGVIGAFVPILPTTPFLILSAFLFSKSSPRFHEWILNLPLAGAGIKDWRENRIINPKAKILCASMISFSIFMIWLNPKIFLGIKFSVTTFLGAVAVFVLGQKSRRD